AVRPPRTPRAHEGPPSPRPAGSSASTEGRRPRDGPRHAPSGARADHARSHRAGVRAARVPSSTPPAARGGELLESLLPPPRKLVSREMLAREVWRETARATPIDNVIDVHIGRLRKKGDPDGARRLIHNVRRVT